MVQTRSGTSASQSKVSPPTSISTPAALTLDGLTKAQRRKLQSLSRQHERGATLGVLNMLVTVVVAVRFAPHYWIWHFVRTLVYLPLRYVRFRKSNQELFLLDWCYMVTYLSMLCAILASVRVTLGWSTPLVDYNTELIQAGFAMASGPLAWSVFVFRNSIVFHDVDYSTSVFIHLSPVVLFWCLRWGAGQPSSVPDTYPDMFLVCDSAHDYAKADACLTSWRGMLWCSACDASWHAFVVPPGILYFGVWSVPYFSIVLVAWKDWCRETKHETLYSYLCATQPEVMEWVTTKMEPVVGREWAGPVGYMVLHGVSMLVFCSTSYLLWHSFVLHTLLMVFVLAKAIDNGSSFMFRVFAYRYAQDSLEKHRVHLE